MSNVAVVERFNCRLRDFEGGHQFARGVYMRKLALARVSYRDYFLISYRVYMMIGSFHISPFEGTRHVDKIHV